MNTYKLHVTAVEDNKWIGHAILNENIEFTTNVCDTPQECSQILTKYAVSQKQNLAPQAPVERPTSSVAPGTPAPQRLCCGRG